MGKKRVFAAFLLVITILAAGCSKNNETTQLSMPDSASYIEEYLYDADYNLYNTTDDAKGYDNYEAKRITSGSVSMETKDFDGVIGRVEGIVREMGGYIENSNMYVAGDSLRRMNYTLRIPSEYYDVAILNISELGKVLSTQSSVSAVTEQYYDSAARLSAKEAEEARLLELIDQAGELSDLILLEQRLASVRTDIEIYTSRMTNIDRKASYASIWINIAEVMDIYSANTLWDRIAKAFKDSLHGIAVFIQNVLVFLVSAALPLVILAVIVLLGWRVFKRFLRRGKIKRSPLKKPDGLDNVQEVVKSLVEDVSNDPQNQK